MKFTQPFKIKREDHKKTMGFLKREGVIGEP